MEFTKQELEERMKRNGGWLNLRDTPITSLPEGLTVGGGLDLRDTQITSLREGLTVGGWLDLSDIKMAQSELQKVHLLKNGDHEDKKYIFSITF